MFTIPGGRVCVAFSVNIVGGLGGLIRWIFWLIRWKFVDYPWARVVLYENRVLASKIGALRVVLYDNRICNGNVTLSQKQIPAGHYLGGRGLRPDPLDSLADPLDVLGNIYAGSVTYTYTRNVTYISGI